MYFLYNLKKNNNNNK